jgi:hypothetical protein
MKINFYQTIKKSKPAINPNIDKHGIEVPFRMVIASGSGTGKTHALCRLIYEFGKTWNEIHVCCPSCDEPLYNMMDERLNNNKHKGVIFHEDDEVPNLMDYAIKQPNGKLKQKDDLQRLIIFDDYMVNKKVNLKIKDFFLRGRKCRFSSIYISQNYYQVPRDVRINTQLFMLGRNIQDADIKMILRIFSIKLDNDQFVEIYDTLTSQPLDTILIDTINKTLVRNVIDERYLFNNAKNCLLSYNLIITDN